MFLLWRRLFISEAVSNIETIIEDIKTDLKEQQCPECESTWIEHDFKRDETVCHECGLVLSGPPSYVAGLFQIRYPVQYNFFAEAVAKGKKVNNGFYRAYYYFPEYTNDLN